MTHPRELRRPTPAELGLNVTVGIVAVSLEDRCFVAVSDQRLSYQDLYPATDRAARKTMQCHDNWHITFAADDVSVVTPVFQKLAIALKPFKAANPPSTTDVREAAEKAYADTLRGEFVAHHLVQFGFKSIDEFRVKGLKQLGKRNFTHFRKQLSEFRLGGLELIVFGFDQEGRPRLFEVHHPGRIVHVAVQGYSVVGSGYSMAVASLRRKPMLMKTQDLVYRLLEAKFSAESTVGRATTAMIVTQNDARHMSEDDIAAIRAIWENTLNEPTPDEAVAAIVRSGILPG